jgi:hypothetical protein
MNKYIEKDPIIIIFNKYQHLDRLIMDPVFQTENGEIIPQRAALTDMWCAIKEYCRMKGYKAALELEGE